jgi:hypothetical protein
VTEPAPHRSLIVPSGEVSSVRYLQGFTHAPVSVRALWVPSIVATNPPRNEPRLEWEWECELHAPEPLVVAVLIDDGTRVRYARRPRSEASTTLDMRLAVRPWSWRESDVVQIAAGFIWTYVASALLKHDPPTGLPITVRDGDMLRTGAVVDVARLQPPAPDVMRWVILAARDVESCRNSRWRVRSALGEHLLPDLGFLTRGRRAGYVRLARNGGEGALREP